MTLFFSQLVVTPLVFAMGIVATDAFEPHSLAAQSSFSGDQQADRIVSGPTADTDADLLPDLSGLLASLDPQIANTRSPIEQTIEWRHQRPVFVYRFALDPDSPPSQIAIQASEDFANWTDRSLDAPELHLTLAGARARLEFEPAFFPAFSRLQATPSPDLSTPDPNDFVVYAFSQSNVGQEDPQVYELKPDINIRAIAKWSTTGDQAADYNFDQVARYHQNEVVFIGGGTASVIFREDFASDAIFDDMSTRDANGQPVPHDEIVPGLNVAGARRGNLFNPAYREYLLNWAKIQIDGGVDGLFFDELIGGFSGGQVYNYNGNEGFDDYALADFNRYLIEKYPDFTATDWKSRFGMTGDNFIRSDQAPDDLDGNFNYRAYLQANGWNGDTTTTSPLNPANPLAAEWGSVINNRMYANDSSFTATYLRRYWKEMVDELRAYAMLTGGRRLLITSNGILPYVDFNSVGMYTFNPDQNTPSGTGADYVPVVDGHLNGAKSLQANYRYLKERSSEVAGDAPVVIFIDWPNDVMTDYQSLPLTEKMDYWQIFGAEAYANALYPAFHLKDTVGDPTAEESGILGFFQTYTQFYKDHRGLYQNNDYAPEVVTVSVDDVSASLLMQPGSPMRTLHLVNHNYNRAILPQGAFQVTVDLAAEPASVTMISPDFSEEKTPSRQFSNGTLSVDVDGIEYYNVIVIE